MNQPIILIMFFGAFCGLVNCSPVYNFDDNEAEDIEQAKILHDNTFGQRIEKRNPPTSLIPNNEALSYQSITTSVVKPLNIPLLSGVAFQQNHNQLHVENAHVISDVKNSTEETIIIESHHQNKEEKAPKAKRHTLSEEENSKSDEDSNSSEEDKLHRVPIYSRDGSLSRSTTRTTTTTEPSSSSTAASSRSTTKSSTTVAHKSTTEKNESEERVKEEELKEKIEEVEAEPVILTQGV